MATMIITESNKYEPLVVSSEMRRQLDPLSTAVSKSVFPRVEGRFLIMDPNIIVAVIT